ncbi:S1C family serine protease [Cerasicoccus frondis]|uniref:S1C family serine protease n=1 Tax=Cerasicoccus frondis TaxID=490090 RepID=UPI002852B448|nr:serine protease [Cerasicoccus frondis]
MRNFRYQGIKPLLIMLCLHLCSGLQLSAEEQSNELLERTLPATAMVVINGIFSSGSGSAFCIDETGVFITNHHVIDGAKTVDLILNAGEDDEFRVPAFIVRTNPKYDLAVLIPADFGQRTYPKLSIGSDSDLKVDQAATVIGFPYGYDKATTAGLAPKPTVTTGTLAKLHQKKNRTELVEFSVIVNPGNSGGPVFDDAGNVVAVIVAHRPDSTVTYAIPTFRVLNILEAPILFAIPYRAATLTSPREPIPTRALYWQYGKDNFEDEIWCEIRSSTGSRSMTKSTLRSIGHGVYEGEFALVAEGANLKIPTQLAQSGESSTKTHAKQVTVQDFKLPGFEDRWYSELKEVRFGESPVIEFADGETFEQELTLPQKIELSTAIYPQQSSSIKNQYDYWIIEPVVNQAFKIFYSPTKAFDYRSVAESQILISVTPGTPSEEAEPENISAAEWKIKSSDQVICIRPGGRLRHQLDILGTEPPLSYELLEGPVEMGLSKTGYLDWQSPIAGQIDPVVYTYAVTDATGKRQEFTAEIYVPIVVPGGPRKIFGSREQATLDYIAAFFRAMIIERDGTALVTPYGNIEDGKTAFVNWQDRPLGFRFSVKGFYFKLQIHDGEELVFESRPIAYP